MIRKKSQIFYKKIQLLLIVICFSLIKYSFADDAVAQEQLFKRIEEAKTISVYITSIFYIKDSADRIHEERGYGTGFVIDTTKAPGLKIVTNRHVLELNLNGQKIRANKVLIKVNLPNINEPVYYIGKIIGLSEKYDIAILTLDRLYNIVNGIEVNKTKDDKTYISLANKALLIEQQFGDDNVIREGTEVYSIGYPLRLGGEEYKNFPVVRKGMIAQRMPESKIFLMDGFVSQGGSGSPAISLTAETPKLLGIVEGAYPESYPVKADSMFNSGLSVVISAPVIKEYVYELIDKGILKAEW